MGDLSKRCEQFLFNELLSDVVLIVHSKDGSKTERIPAHKLILISGSDCFKAMFTGDLATVSKEQDIHEVEPIGMRSLLTYLYTDKIELNEENILPTYQAAKMYSVPLLEEACHEFLLQSFHTQDIFAVLITVDLHNDRFLAEEYSDWIYEEHVKETTSSQFKQIDLSTLACFLRSTKRGDTHVYDAVWSWAGDQCIRDGVEAVKITPSDRRDRVKSIIHLIKFHEFEPYDFAGWRASNGLLSKEESFDVFISLRNKMKKSPCRCSYK